MKDTSPSTPSTPPSKPGGIITEVITRVVDVDLVYGLDDVRAFFDAHCLSCHRADGSASAYWIYQSDRLTPAYLNDNEIGGRIYQALGHSLHQVSEKRPKPMPPGVLNEKSRAQQAAVIQWFHAEAPLAVVDAGLRYGALTSKNPVEFSFRCTNPVTTRAFLNRFAQAAFDRPPTSTELSDFTDEQLDQPVTAELRREIVGSAAGSDAKSEFLDQGIRKLGAAIAGSALIPVRNTFLSETIADLREEFSQLLKEQFSTWSYERYFTENQVMTSGNTHFLYGCPDPGDNWQLCTLDGTRSGFFTSIGYLASRPSTFMSENNNYHRVAGMYFVMFGEGVTPATDGPRGETVSEELPGCLEAKDHRYLGTGPRGVAAVPQSGSVCRTCHLEKHLAAGSILFRPYSRSGQLYDPTNLSLTDTDDFTAAIGAGWTQDGETPVDLNFLADLLTSPVKSCDASASGTNKVFLTAADLSKHLIGDGRTLLTGLARHAHRAFAANNSVPRDVLYAMTKRFIAGERTLSALLNEYFLSETFACKSQ